MTSGGTHILFCWSSHPLVVLEDKLIMLNNHFFKTLFIFLMIIASGVLLILAVDYTDNSNTEAEVSQSK